MRPKLFKSHRQKPLGFGNIFIFTIGGAEGIRTHDILLAKQALYQLSYGPLGGPPAPRESSGAIQAIHRPRLRLDGAASLIKGGDPAAGSPTATLLRLHPSHRPYLRRLPPSRVGPAPSGMVGSHDVTGGVYKARERIQGAVADAPLLAIPASCSRVAGCNPNWGGLSRFGGPRGPPALCTRHCSTFAAPGVGAIRT